MNREFIAALDELQNEKGIDKSILLDAIENGRTPKIDGREGRRSVEVICAVYEAARKGATVKLG